MFMQAMLPCVQSGNSYTVTGANSLHCRVPFEIGNQDSKLETEAVRAIRNYDIGEQRMSCVTGRAFKPVRLGAGFEYLFPVVGYKITEIIAIRGKLSHRTAARTVFVMVHEAAGSLLEDGFVR
jgi:hypothetical protein